MSKKKTLYVPDAPFRPGEKPDFSHLKLPKAGDAMKPKIMVEPSEIRDLAFSLVRVLDDKHKAIGPWDPKLDSSILKEGLKHMTLLRIFDKRMQTMHRQVRRQLQSHKVWPYVQMTFSSHPIDNRDSNS